MPDAKPFSDEELEGISAWGRCYNNIEILKMGSEKCFKRFLATIAEYKEALDSAMRQVSSLNRGNIADHRRIEELEEYAEELRGEFTDQAATIAARDRRIEELEITNRELELRLINLGKQYRELSKHPDNTDQAAAIKQLRGENEELQQCIDTDSAGVPITINWEKARALYKRIKALKEG